MSVYSPNLPNAYDTGQVPVHVRSQYYQELVMASPLSMFMGESPTSLIQVIDQPLGQGPTSTFSVLRELDYKTTVQDYDQFSGKEQELKFYVDTIKIKEEFIGDKLINRYLTEIYTPVKVFDALKPSLMVAHKQKITYQLLNSATLGRYNITNQGPIDNRVVYAGGTRDNAGIATSLNSLTGAGLDADGKVQSGGSVADIRKMRNMAVNGGKTAFRQEKRINPYAIESQGGWIRPFYVLFCDTNFIVNLQLDPKWVAQEQRGIVESSDQPSILKGGMLRGRIDDVYIYEVPELGDFRITSADGNKKACWNLFCGAQAFGMIWRGAPMIKTEYRNYEHDVALGIFDFRGQKAIEFPSYSDETKLIENGIIHYFTQYTDA